jgi:signal peptidase I
MTRSRFRPLSTLIVAAASILAAKAFVVDAAVVEGRSMLPGYRPGRVVVVLRCAYGLRWPSGGYLATWAPPRRGDVVAAANPRSGKPVLKRVAAAGPTALVVEAGRLLGPGIDVELGEAARARFGPVPALPAGRYLLLGDNLPESLDSREYGPVPIEAIFGKVLF